MKAFSPKTWLGFGLSLILLAGGTAAAQVLAPGPSAGINAAFVKLLGPGAAFTAKVETQVLDKSQREVVRMPMDFAALDGKVRLSVKLEEMKSKDMPPNVIAGLTQAGMNHVVTIYRPDKKVTYALYPGVQGYTTIQLPKGEVAALQNGLQLTQTALGKETLDGHPCVKHRAIVRNDRGPLLEATTWNATDLKNLPIQIEMKQKDNTVRMHFTQISLVKPDAALFEVPATYKPTK